MNILGEKIRKLRESNGLLQKQIASALEVNVAYVSKMENNEKPVSRNHLKKLSSILHVSEDELLTLWIAEKLYDVAKNENVALKAMKVAQKQLIINSREEK